MESIIKQLVKIGHGMGAEVANDEPAVAKLLVELSSALDVQYERANALEAKCAAMAAENAGLKSKAAELVHEASEVYSAYNATITEPDGDFMDMQTLQEMQSVETPATDAYRNELRAQGIEMAAKSDQFSMWVQQGLRSFAIGVRQGGAE